MQISSDVNVFFSVCCRLRWTVSGVMTQLQHVSNIMRSGCYKPAVTKAEETFTTIRWSDRLSGRPSPWPAAVKVSDLVWFKICMKILCKDLRQCGVRTYIVFLEDPHRCDSYCESAAGWAASSRQTADVNTLMEPGEASTVHADTIQQQSTSVWGCRLKKEAEIAPF